MSYAECCCPIPGDSIEGVLQSGYGIVVHRDQCPKISQLRNKVHNLLALRWDENVVGEFNVSITVEVANQRGVLASLASAISDAEANIGNINVDPRDGRYNTVMFSITVRDRVHLARVLRRIRANNVVVKLYRSKMGAVV